MGRKIYEKAINIGSVNIKRKMISTNQQEPKKRYRILIQERKAEKCEFETMRSFMVHDYKGMSTIDSIKKKLQKAVK